MAGLLTGFLREHASRKWQWGKSDCLLVPADWVLLVTGRDPAERWRGRYSTEQGCARKVKKAGGMLAICEAGLSSIGIEQTDEPRMGDFALIDAEGIGLIGSICVSEIDRAVMTQDMGLVISSIGFKPVAAWRVG